MTTAWCPRESELWEAIVAGRWPDASNAELWTHVSACPICRDAAVVSASLSSEGASARREATPPPAAVVWWRAQLRARRDDARTAERPLTIAQGLAVASMLGIAIALFGSAAAWLRGPLAWIADWRPLAATAAGDAVIDLTARWMLLPAATIVISLVFAPIAVYLITADE